MSSSLSMHRLLPAAAGAACLLLAGCLEPAAPQPDRNELSVAKLEATGTYRIVSAFSGKALDQHLGSTRVQLWTWFGSANQKWRVTHVGGGRHTIANVASGQCLDVDYNAANPAANGRKVQVWACHAGANQRFFIEAMTPGGPGGDRYFLIPAYTDQYSSAVLDVKDWNAGDGAAVQQWQRTTCGGNFCDNQYWRLEPVQP